MIRILFSSLMVEVVVVIALLFKTPLRKLTVMGLDRLKRGRGPVMLKTVAGTLLVMLSSSLYSIASIKNQSTDIGLTPTEQVLMSFHILETSLMGYSLLLALIIDRLHHYIRELRGLRKGMEAVMKQNRSLEDAKNGGYDEIKARDNEIATLKEQISKLQKESGEKLKELKAAEASTSALRKQSEGISIEYNRLLDVNQSLRDQLQAIDLSISHSDSKKLI